MQSAEEKSNVRAFGLAERIRQKGIKKDFDDMKLIRATVYSKNVFKLMLK